MSKRRNRTQHVTVKATCTDKRGRIISTAYNSFSQTHPLQAKLAKQVGMPNRIYVHAELLALIRSRGRKVYKLTVERYDANGNPKNACPCPVCTKALEMYGVSKVEFTVG